MKEVQMMNLPKELKPIDILRQYGHIAKTRDGYFLRYFTNSLGEFLFYEDSVGIELTDFDDNLFHNTIPTGDIVEIYNVDNCIFLFGKNLSMFKNRLDLIKIAEFKEPYTGGITLAYKRY